MQKQSGTFIFGFILILIGVGLLLDRYRILAFSWDQLLPILLLILSITSFISLARGNRNAVFWGVGLAVVGLFYFLKNFDLVPYYWLRHLDGSVILIALGLAFTSLFVVKPSDWGVLIPGGILLLIGLLRLLQEFDVNLISEEMIADYWPAILVLIGLGLIVNTLKKTRTLPK